MLMACLISGASAAPGHATYPWGDKFWFSFYSTIGTDTAYAVEHGATGIGPYYGGTAGDLSVVDTNEHMNAFYRTRASRP